MAGSNYNEDTLSDLLPLYYNRLFPQTVFYKWLCYGDPNKFNRREICFTLYGDIYLRYQSFDTCEEFAQALHKRFPIKIDIGAVYSESLKHHSPSKVPVEREVVFDIDMTDYDTIRTCCSGADVCTKCWKFMIIACKILDSTLRIDFGFKHILWVFSGRRGIHCWIADKKARLFDDSLRSVVAEYLTIIRGTNPGRKVKLPATIHTSLQRALQIIDQYFEKWILIEQDILGDEKGLTEFLNNIDDEFKSYFAEALSKVNTTRERWNAFKNTFHRLLKEQKIPQRFKFMVEEMKLYYAYPRLDINVTKGINHLLKAPFCVHPKTGKISVPFKVKTIDNFDINEVPTISQLMDEINVYDAKTKEHEQKLLETSTEGTPTATSKIKDYKKTSLFKYVAIFNEFLRGLQKAAIEGRAELNDSAMKF